MTRVLVADDNRQFADLLRAILEDAGYDVVIAYSGIAAVTAAQADDLDVAILDVLLPGVSGDAIAERLRRVRPGLPILLMTGAGDQFARAAGVPVLRKPFDHGDLLARVAQLAPRTES